MADALGECGWPAAPSAKCPKNPSPGESEREVPVIGVPIGGTKGDGARPIFGTPPAGELPARGVPKSPCRTGAGEPDCARAVADSCLFATSTCCRTLDRTPANEPGC